MADYFPSDLGHAIAIASAALFLALSLATWRRAAIHGHRATLSLALGVTGGWIAIAAASGPSHPLAWLAEHLRNAAWLGYMWQLSARAGYDRFPRPVRLIYKLLSILVITLVALALAGVAGAVDFAEAPLVTTLTVHLSLIVAVGLLVLVHNLYSIAATDSRVTLAPALAALTALWAYDLNLYTISYFAREPAADLIALRPPLSLVLVPLFAIGWTHAGRAQLNISRSVAFQSLSLVAIGFYLLVMALVADVMRTLGGNYGQLAQTGVLVAALAALLLLAPSQRWRAWMRVKVTKHFFRHRYDYRDEWMRFADTVGRPGDAGVLQERVIKAVADVTGSPGGLLLLPDHAGGLSLQHHWQWPDADAAQLNAPANTARYFETSLRVIEFDDLRLKDVDSDERALFDQAMLADNRVWVGVPIIHFDRLAGLVLLQRPVIDRRLDWEDFDLLKVVGRQIGSYLSEARGQDELSEARRFDEFNRRFAFIMHDIKNVVSQLSILTRNAERHADNPEFRDDMVETLKLSVGRMNTLLGRLSQHHRARTDEPGPVSLQAVIERVSAGKKALHPVLVNLDQAAIAHADAGRIEQILLHLLQNAIEASPAFEPVRIVARVHGDEVAIDVIDHGCGMSGEFIRNDLFKPFSSTKDGGFGVGAFEARSLAVGMAGRLEVESRPGQGSRITLWLPRSDTHDFTVVSNIDSDRSVA